jgi:hypothetical protein
MFHAARLRDRQALVECLTGVRNARGVSPEYS